MTDSRIAAKLRELDAACPGGKKCGLLMTRQGFHTECVWLGHRLARELAMKVREVTYYQYFGLMHTDPNKCLTHKEWNAALPLEEVEDE